LLPLEKGGVPFKIVKKKKRDIKASVFTGGGRNHSAGGGKRNDTRFRAQKRSLDMMDCRKRKES